MIFNCLLLIVVAALAFHLADTATLDDAKYPVDRRRPHRW
jgi:hypothetical protein